MGIFDEREILVHKNQRVMKVIKDILGLTERLQWLLI